MPRSRKSPPAWVNPPPILVGMQSVPPPAASPRPKKKPRPAPPAAEESPCRSRAPAPLKALSLRQPWAEEIVRGQKLEEYRQQATQVRGVVYLYASRSRWSPEVEAEIALEVGYDLEDLPRGVLVGTVEIVDCEPLPDGTYAWQLANPRRLPVPLAPRERPQPVWFHPFGRS